MIQLDFLWGQLEVSKKYEDGGHCREARRHGGEQCRED